MDAVIAQERQERVRAHWDRQPCDSELSTRERLSREFYLDVERQRYALQPHILEILSWIDWRGKRVLEVGAGVGTDARLIVITHAALERDMQATLKELRDLDVVERVGSLLRVVGQA